MRIKMKTRLKELKPPSLQQWKKIAVKGVDALGAGGTP